MTKEEARAILEMYFAKGGIPPLFDCVVYRYVDAPNGIQIDYTFRHLLCIVYDLKSIEDEKAN